MELTIFGYKIRVEMVILMGILYLITVTHTICACCNKEKITQGFTNIKESFSNLNNSDFTSKYSLSNLDPIDTSKWENPNLTVEKGKPMSDGVKDILKRDVQTLPLPEGQMDILSTTKFSLDCCPNTYSNSSGCACMTTDQYNYLSMRGGNNVPYSEY